MASAPQALAPTPTAERGARGLRRPGAKFEPRYERRRRGLSDPAICRGIGQTLSYRREYAAAAPLLQEAVEGLTPLAVGGAHLFALEHFKAVKEYNAKSAEGKAIREACSAAVGRTFVRARRRLLRRRVVLVVLLLFMVSFVRSFQ